MQGKTDNYDTDLFVNLKRAVSDITGVAETAENIASFKVITDHLRSVGFAIADGVIPSNTDRGYVIRRILRRAMRHGQILGHKGALLSKLYPALITEMGDAYPELAREQARVVEILQNEENAFADMLQNGMKLLENEIPKLNNNVLPGDVAFKLFDTYGFPLDLTQMILRDRNIDVDVAGFEKSMAEQKNVRAQTHVEHVFSGNPRQIWPARMTARNTHQSIWNRACYQFCATANLLTVQTPVTKSKLRWIKPISMAHRVVRLVTVAN